MVSRYVTNTPVKQEGICLLPQPHSHYRMIQPQRSDFHVAGPPTFVPQQQQPPNQAGNLGLRNMAPTGPPTQSSTPPNSDIKVSHVQQAPMGFSVQQRSNPSFYNRPPQNAARIVTSRTGTLQSQQGIFPQQHSQILMPQYMHVPVMHQVYFNTSNRPAGPQYVQPNSYLMGTPSPVAYPNQYHMQTGPYNPTAYYPNVSRQPQHLPTLQTPMTHPPPLATGPHHQMRTKTKTRNRAIPIIHPETGKQVMNVDDNAHPDSGESSARQTPQPQPVVPVAMAQQQVPAVGVNQVYKQVKMDGDSGVQQTDPMDGQQQQQQQQHHVMDNVNVGLVSNQAVPNVHSTYQVNPQTVNSRNDISKSSKSQVPTEFVPANHSHTAKETPVVSALTNAVEVTITGKHKDRESPAKNRKKEQKDTAAHSPAVSTTAAASAGPKEVATAGGASAATTVTNVGVAGTPPSFNKEPQVLTAPVDQVKMKEDNKSSKDVESKSLVKDVPQQQQPQRKADALNADKPKRTPTVAAAAPATADVSKQENVVAENVVHLHNLSTNQPDSTGKSKQSQKSKEQQQQQKHNAGGPQTSANQQHQLQQQQQQNQKPIAVPVSQPAKPNNKSHKLKELNMKGANKEGTDMDAFNLSMDAINANVSAGKPPLAPETASQQQQPHVDQQCLTTQSQMEHFDENNSRVAVDSTAATNLKDDKNVPKNKVDGVANVKMNPPVETAAAVAKDETDRAVPSVQTDKFVQAKNEANTKTAVTNDNQIDIKAPVYPKGQWGPHNPDGKKCYDIDFLKALRNYPSSQTKPTNIPTDVAAGDDRSRIGDISRCANISGRTDFAPSFGGGGNFAGKSQSQRIAPTKRSQQGKPSGNSKGGKSGSVIRVSISFKEDVKLHESENAWKPTRLVGSSTDEDDKKTEELCKKVRGVLNKLTPQKFNTLLNQIKALPIDTQDRLDRVITLVFEKAVEEPNFSLAYALMCKELSNIQVPISSENSKEFVNFRKLLITKCQREFEKNAYDEESRIERLKLIDECTDPEKKKELLFQLEEEDRRIRMKSVGNIRFIGELYKQEMLTVNIMQRCLSNLLENREEDSLECLCKLLTTIGKELESKGVKLVGIFETMKQVANNKSGKVSSRVRFMLQDVIDLRATGWVPRRTDVNPKTMDQIQKEVDNEQMLIQLNNSTPIAPRRDDRNIGANSDRNKRSRNTNEEGWCVANTRGKHSQQFTFQSEKLKVSITDNAPLGNKEMFNPWGRGSNFKAPPSTSGTNKYAILDSVDNRPLMPRLNNKEPYSSKGSSLERVGKYDGRRSRSGSHHRSNESLNRSTPTPPQQAPKLQEPQTAYENLNEEELEKRAHAIAEEFILNAKIDAELEFKCYNPNVHEFLVTEMYSSKLDRSKTARLKLGEVFTHLIKREVLAFTAYCNALEKVFALTEDLVVDIPNIWDCYAEITYEPLKENVLTLNSLLKCADCLVEQKTAHLMFAAIFKLIIQEKGPNFLLGLWKSSGLTFAAFVPADMVDAYVTKHDLKFLTESDAKVTGQNNLTFDQIYQKLNQFVKTDATFDDLCKWIEANVGDRVTDKQFIRTLCTVLIENSIVNEKLDFVSFHKSYNAFSRYIDCNDDFELQCLFAVQAIVNKLDHPQGLLLDIFHNLYDDSIISYDSFIAWESSNDPAGQEKKGVAMKQLTSFFTRLKENDEEEVEESSASDEA